MSMKVTSVTLQFDDAPAGAEYVKVTARKFTSGVGGTATNVTTTLTSGSATVTISGLDGGYSFYSTWLDSSGALISPIGTCFFPANL